MAEAAWLLPDFVTFLEEQSIGVDPAPIACGGG